MIDTYNNTSRDYASVNAFFSNCEFGENYGIYSVGGVYTSIKMTIKDGYAGYYISSEPTNSLYDKILLKYRNVGDEISTITYGGGATLSPGIFYLGKTNPFE